MTRIVFFCGALSEGGAERVISILSKEFIKKDFNVEILMYYNLPVFYKIDKNISIRIIEEENKGEKIISNIFWLRQYFKENADVVISFLAPFNILAIGATIFSNIPIIVADRNDPRKVPNNFFKRKFRNLMYCFANGVVVQTVKNKKYFNKIIQKKSIVIPNPVLFSNNKGKAIYSQKQKEIVSVGRLMPQKNQLMLIHSFSEIHKKFPEYKLIIYGEGPMRARLKKEIINLNLQEYVSLPGNVKDIKERIVHAELFVMTSDYEGMSNSLIEAMCLGLPVISTAVSGAKDLIKNEENGIVIGVGDEMELNERMLELLYDKEKRIYLGTNAVNISDQLDINKVMGQWTVLINKIKKRNVNK